MRRVLVVATLAACTGDGKGGDHTGVDDPLTSYTFDCAVSEPYTLADPFDGLAGNEYACEDQPYYNPNVPYSTTYFVGEFHYDDCGNLRGKETVLFHANQTWVDLGGHDCRIVYSIDGLATPSGGGGATLDIAGVVDAAETTCGDIQNSYGEEFLDGFEASFNVQYEVSTIGGEATFFFPSGDELGRGEANANHSNYLSAFQCMAF